MMTRLFLKWFSRGTSVAKTFVTSASPKQCESIKNISSTINLDPPKYKVGDSVMVTKFVSEADLDKFCKLSGDFNTVHTESRIIHGALINGLVSGVMGTLLPGPGSMVLSQTLNFPNSCTAPQDIIVTVTMTSARKIILCEFECCTTKGVVVLVGEAKLIKKKGS